MSTTSKRLRTLVATGAIATTVALVLAGCGARAGDDTPGGESAAPSCVDTSGDTIKLGFLNSLTGGMAISEKTVSNVLHMAADEINAGGGILGKKIKYVQEDGATDWPTFAEKTEKLLTQDCVAAIFGGWTSSSRKAVKPVVEKHNGLFFYPVQYEGLEASKNIYYTGATTNQQIIPAMDFLASKGVKKLFLAGSDYVFPRTANAIIKLYAAKLASRSSARSTCPSTRTTGPPRWRKSWRPSPTSSSTPSTARRTSASSRPTTTPASRRRRRRSSRCRSPRRRRRPWATRSPATTRPGTTSSRSRPTTNPKFIDELEGLPQQQRRHLRPDGGRLHLAVPVQGPRRGGRLVRRRQGERRGEGEAHHVRRTGGHGHARRREPPHLEAGPHRPDQRQTSSSTSSGPPTSSSSPTRSSRATTGSRRTSATSS